MDWVVLARGLAPVTPVSLRASTIRRDFYANFSLDRPYSSTGSGRVRHGGDHSSHTAGWSGACAASDGRVGFPRRFHQAWGRLAGWPLLQTRPRLARLL